MLEASKGQRGTCTVGLALKALPDDTADTFRQLFPKAVARQVKFTALADAFEKRGFPMRGNTVSRHARGKCDCDD